MTGEPIPAEVEDHLAHMQAYHGLPECFVYNGQPGFAERMVALHDEYHDRLEDGDQPGSANFNGRAPAHAREDLSR